jgi:hypothetical protein
LDGCRQPRQARPELEPVGLLIELSRLHLDGAFHVSEQHLLDLFVKGMSGHHRHDLEVESEAAVVEVGGGSGHRKTRTYAGGGSWGRPGEINRAREEAFQQALTVWPFFVGISMIVLTVAIHAIGCA